MKFTGDGPISKLRTYLLLGALAGAVPATAQEKSCFSDSKSARLAVDFQAASLLCPKWKVVSRVDFGYFMLTLGLLNSDDLVKSKKAGILTLTGECQDKLSELETESFQKAEASGLDLFCTRTSHWLTVPNVRYALETNGFFPSNLP